MISEELKATNSPHAKLQQHMMPAVLKRKPTGEPPADETISPAQNRFVSLLL
jgi:hypothetical protein